MGFRCVPDGGGGGGESALDPPTPAVVTTLSPEGVFWDMREVNSMAIGYDRLWTANRAIYLPVILPQDITIAQMFWENGTAVAGNTDVGIYDASLTKLVSTGAVANAGVSQLQAVNIADTLLPGEQLLWMALASDSGAQRYVGFNPNGAAAAFVGYKFQNAAWAAGLPASPTFTDPSNTISLEVPVFGFTSRAGAI